MKILLTLEYNGAAFSGWQKQENMLTVQGELERAVNLYFNALAKKSRLLHIDNSSDDGSSDVTVPYISIQGSGRTDAGVHAEGQCADFAVPDGVNFELKRIAVALNGIVDKNIVVHQASVVDDNFNSRLTPHSKCYSYKFLLQRERPVLDKGFGWNVGNKLNIKAMLEAAKLFNGSHDFRAFRASDCNSTTTVRWIEKSELVRIDETVLQYFVVGRGFLKQMVRIIAGTLVDVGRGKISVQQVGKLLENGGELERKHAGETAPAGGLCLEWVRYL